jgi:hypothetical protein
MFCENAVGLGECFEPLFWEETLLRENRVQRRTGVTFTEDEAIPIRFQGMCWINI